MPDDKLELYLKAIDFTADDLEREISMVSEDGPAPPVPWWTVFPVQLEVFIATDESMSPWCEPGEKVFFERGRHPKRLEGCVVEWQDGARTIRLFERGGEGQVTVRRVNPDVSETYAQADIAGLHRIALRGD